MSNDQGKRLQENGEKSRLKGYHLFISKEEDKIYLTMKDQTPIYLRIKHDGHELVEFDYQPKGTFEEFFGIRPISLDAIYGIVTLKDENYLIAVTKSRKVASVLDQEIYLATEFKFIGLNCGFTDSKVGRVDKKCIQMFQRWLKKEIFYFSYSFDLSKRLQKQAGGDTGGAESGPDLDFVYNHCYSKALRDKKLKVKWCQDFINGFAKTIQIPVSESSEAKINLTVISRRCKNRDVLNYRGRGLDEEGNVSNHVETETILEVIKTNQESRQSADLYSFVALRASIPLLWKFEAGLKPFPAVFIDPDQKKRSKAFKIHYNWMKKEYGGPVEFLNLVKKNDSAKRQSKLGVIFRELVKKEVSPQAESYHWIDLETRIKGFGGNPKRLEKLIEDIQAVGNYHGYAKIEVRGLENSPNLKNSKLVKKQVGVVRTNCMACIDRTNIAQTFIAVGALQKIVAENGIKVDEVSLTQSASTVWVENGHAVCKAHTGSDTLKSNYAQKRLITGSEKVRDLAQGLKRYIKYQGFDVYEQNCLDFLLGLVHWEDLVKDRSYECLYLGRRFLFLVTLPFLICLGINWLDSFKKGIEYKPKTFNVVMFFGMCIITSMVFTKIRLNVISNYAIINHSIGVKNPNLYVKKGKN